MFMQKKQADATCVCLLFLLSGMCLLSAASALIIGVFIPRTQVFALLAAAHTAKGQIEQNVQYDKHGQHNQNDLEYRALEEVAQLVGIIEDGASLHIT